MLRGPHAGTRTGHRPDREAPRAHAARQTQPEGGPKVGFDDPVVWRHGDPGSPGRRLSSSVAKGPRRRGGAGAARAKSHAARSTDSVALEPTGNPARPGIAAS